MTTTPKAGYYKTHEEFRKYMNSLGYILAFPNPPHVHRGEVRERDTHKVIAVFTYSFQHGNPMSRPYDIVVEECHQ